MQEAQPSRTAMATAFMRALHTRIDDPPAVFDDRAAFALLPDYQRRFIRRLTALTPDWLRRYRARRDLFTAMRAQVVIRARYAEDALTDARAGGVNRYVVLAAGLDTFALRQVEPKIDVLEIDHPATQRWKRDLFEHRGIAVPQNLTFLPVDFELQTLAEVWPDNPGTDFISWLGTSYYLSRTALCATLTTLAERTRPGSRLVLDYWSEPPPTDPASWLLWGTRVAVALQQEPMRSFFDPAEITALAADCGWQVRDHLTAMQQNRDFLAGRRDGLAVPSFAHLLQLER